MLSLGLVRSRAPKVLPLLNEATFSAALGRSSRLRSIDGLLFHLRGAAACLNTGGSMRFSGLRNLVESHTFCTADAIPLGVQLYFLG